MTALLTLYGSPVSYAQDDVPAVAATGSAGDVVWTVRVASFRDAGSAWALIDNLKEDGFEPSVVRLFDSRGRLWNVVQVGDYPSRSQALISSQSFKRSTGMDSIVRKMDAGLLAERETRDPDAAPPLLPSRLREGSKPMPLADPGDLFYEIRQDDILSQMNSLQRQRLKARIMFRRGYADDAIRLFEKLVRNNPDIEDLRAEYINTLIDNGDYLKSRVLLQKWLDRKPDSRDARSTMARLDLLTGNYVQRRASVKYLRRLRPEDTGALSEYAYSAQAGNDWLEALNSFSELVDREPDNLDAREALSQILRQRRPRLSLTPRIYLQPDDTSTNSLTTSFSMQMDGVTRVEFLHDITHVYRPQGDGIDKIDRTINEGAVLVRRDLSRKFTAIVGLGGYDGSASGVSGALGFEWAVHDSGTVSAMLDVNDPWIEDASAVNHKGRYNQVSATYNGFYNDSWGVFFNGQVRQYLVEEDRLYGTKGLYNIILTKKISDLPELYVSYSYYRSHFIYEDQNYTPIDMVLNESIHTLSASYSQQLFKSLRFEMGGGIRMDEFKTSPSYFAAPNLVLNLCDRWELNAGYEYSSDSGIAGGGETQTITGSVIFLF